MLLHYSLSASSIESRAFSIFFFYDFGFITGLESM